MSPEQRGPGAPLVEAQLRKLGLDVVSWSGDEANVRCTFHDDTNPSMRVNVTKGLYYCHGCGARGKLAEFGKVAVPEETQLDALSRELEQLTSTPLADRGIPESALDRYRGLGTEWWLGRGVTDNVIDRFDLGFDVLGDAAVIPWRSIGGRLLGLVRRQLSAEPKYLYSRGLRIHHHLYGAHLASQVPLDRLALVEGPIDALACWSVGVPAVAMGSASLSEAQLELLCQLGPRQVLIATDADKAGRAAARHLLGVLPIWLDATELWYPEGHKDPGELLQAGLLEEWLLA